MNCLWKALRCSLKAQPCAHWQGTVTTVPCSAKVWGTVTCILEWDSIPGVLHSRPKRRVITHNKSTRLVWFWQSESPMVRRQDAV